MRCRAFARNRGLLSACLWVSLGWNCQGKLTSPDQGLSSGSQHGLLMGALHSAGSPPALPVNKPCCGLCAHTVTACSDNVDLFDFADSGMSIGLPGPPGPPGTPGISYSDLTAYLRSKPTSILPCHGALHAPRIFFTALVTEFPFLAIITNNPLMALCP